MLRVTSLASLLTLRARTSKAVGAALFLWLLSATVYAQGAVPWLEGYEIPTLNSITTAQRLRETQVFMVNQADLTACSPSECPQVGYWLDVHAWARLHGRQSANSNPLLCLSTPLYGQATPGARCSGTLVGEDLILSAGHCNPSEADGCANLAIVFDFELAFVNDPTGDPSAGRVFLRSEQVIDCAEVVRNTDPLAPPGDPEQMDEAFLNPPKGSGGGDWAILRLVEDVPASRLPVPIERGEISAVGNDAICMTHPARLPNSGTRTGFRYPSQHGRC